jgi:hypothetical protein
VVVVVVGAVVVVVVAGTVVVGAVVVVGGTVVVDEVVVDGTVVVGAVVVVGGTVVVDEVLVDGTVVVGDGNGLDGGMGPMMGGGGAPPEPWLPVAGVVVVVGDVVVVGAWAVPLGVTGADAPAKTTKNVPTYLWTKPYGNRPSLTTATVRRLLAPKATFSR